MDFAYDALQWQMKDFEPADAERTTSSSAGTAGSPLKGDLPPTPAKAPLNDGSVELAAEVAPDTQYVAEQDKDVSVQAAKNPSTRYPLDESLRTAQPVDVPVAVPAGIPPGHDPFSTMTPKLPDQTAYGSDDLGERRVVLHADISPGKDKSAVTQADDEWPEPPSFRKWMMKAFTRNLDETATQGTRPRSMDTVVDRSACKVTDPAATSQTQTREKDGLVDRTTATASEDALIHTPAGTSSEPIRTAGAEGSYLMQDPSSHVEMELAGVDHSFKLKTQGDQANSDRLMMRIETCSDTTKATAMSAGEAALQGVIDPIKPSDPSEDKSAHTQPADYDPTSVEKIVKQDTGSSHTITESIGGKDEMSPIEGGIADWRDGEAQCLELSPPREGIPDTDSRATLPYAASLRHWDSMVGGNQSPHTEISVGTWEDIAKPLRERASASWTRLSRLMESHAHTIITLWRGEPGAEDMTGKEGQRKRKLIRQLRMNLIAEHWPDMASEHRPDIRVFMHRKPTDDLLPDPDDERCSSPEGKSARLKREALLWPHMNTDYLVTRWWYLAQMLRSRSWRPINHFALEDMPPGRRDFLELFIRCKNVPGYCMAINPMYGFYGTLFHTESPDAELHCFKLHLVLSAGQGLLLLEVQERLYRFLADMAEAIVQSQPTTTPAPTSSKDRTDHEDSRLVSGAAAWMPVVWVADERDEAPYSGSKAQYHRPECLERRRTFNRILCRAKYNEALDHWELLRNDLAYFREMINLWKEHRVELLPDAERLPGSSEDPSAESSPSASCADLEAVNINAIKDCVTTAFEKVIYWDEAMRRADFVGEGVLPTRPRFGEQACDVLDSQGPEPDGRARARGLLYSFLSLWEGPSLLLLRKLWSFSPNTRPYHRRRAPEASEPTGTSLLRPEKDDEWSCDQDFEYESPKPGKKSQKCKKGNTTGTASPIDKKRPAWEYFEWLVNSLFDRRVRALLGLQTILDEIDNLISSSPQAMKTPGPEYGMLSELVWSQLADLAAHSELFDSEFKSETEAQYGLRTMRQDQLQFVIEEELKFEDRWQGGYDVPLETPEDDAIVAEGCTKKSNGVWTFEGGPEMWSCGLLAINKIERKKSETAEKAFRDFWARFVGELEAHRVCDPRHKGLGVVDLDKNASNKNSHRVSQEYVTGQHRADSGTAGIESEALLSHAGPRPLRTVEQSTCGDETERGTESSYVDEDDAQRVSRRLTGYDIRLDVDERALKVFKTMLVPATDGWDPAPVSWKDFVHALLQADFKLFCRYGREWLAVPPDAQRQPGLIYRQPRRGQKIAVSKLYRYGLRLVRASGGNLAYSQFSKRKVEENRAGENELAGGDVFGTRHGSGCWIGSPYDALHWTNAGHVPGVPRHEWSLL